MGTRLRVAHGAIAWLTWTEALLLAQASGQTSPPTPSPPAQRVEVPLAVGFQRVLQAHSGEILMLIGSGGELRSLGPIQLEGGSKGAEDRFAKELLGSQSLPQPERCIFSNGRLDQNTDDSRQSALFVSGPGGLLRFDQDDAGQFSAEGLLLERRANFTLYTGTPRAVEFLSDVDRDAFLDLTLPGVDAISLWWNRADATGQRSLERSGSVAVSVPMSHAFLAQQLSDRLHMDFTIPRLVTEDLNADLRPDLIVVQDQRQAFHLHRLEEGFPEKPDVVCDLGLFRDSGAKEMSLAPGSALSGDGFSQLERRDLSGDGIPDYVITHGRKLWVFLGKPSGPQFTEPSTVLRSAEPITAVLFSELDDDGKSDLLLLRVEVPSIPTLVLGLFSEWDVPVLGHGYRNLGQGKFETKPFRSRELALRLPALLSLARSPYELIERFREAGANFREYERADLDGDGAEDLLLLSRERNAVEVYLGQGEQAQRFSEADLERQAREQFFEAKETVWDLDRILSWLGGMANEQVRSWTGGKVPSAVLQLEATEPIEVHSISAIDLNADGKRSLLVIYERRDLPGWRRFDLHDLPGSKATSR